MIQRTEKAAGNVSGEVLAMIDMDENTASCVPPAAFAERMPARPFLTSEPLGWTDTTVQRYSMSRLAFEVPPARDVRLCFNLADPLLVGARLGSDEHAPRWLDPESVVAALGIGVMAYSPLAPRLRHSWHG